MVPLETPASQVDDYSTESSPTLSSTSKPAVTVEVRTHQIGVPVDPPFVDMSWS